MRNKLIFGGGMVLILILYIPFFIFGENSYLGSPADYLDSNTVWLKILSESGMSFSSNGTPLPNIENQYRVSYGNELDFIYLLFKILTPFYALVINSLIICITGYFSLFTLGKYIAPKIDTLFLVLISITFSVLNFWQFGGISTAGAPLIVLIFLKLLCRQRVHFLYYAFATFYILYSSFIVYGMFLIFLLVICALYSSIIKKKIEVSAFVFVFLLGAGYLVTNYRFILETLHPSFVSNRNIGIAGEMIWDTGVKTVFERFWTENGSHAPARHQFMIFSFFIYCLVSFFLPLKNIRKVILLFCLILFTCIFSYFNINMIPEIIKALKLDFLYGLTLYRFYFFNGLLWYIIMIFILEDFSRINKKPLTIVTTLFIFVNLYTVLRINISYQNIRHSFREYYFSFKDYYMHEEFEKISKLLPEDKTRYRVISYGFDPAAAQYHGYYTADGYFPYYEKSYKQKFRKLITPILNKNTDLQIKYDAYMSQNFVFTDGFRIGEQVLQKYSKKPKELEIDKAAADDLEIKYILSTIPLTNSYLELHNEISSKYWKKIYIYNFK